MNSEENTALKSVSDTIGNAVSEIENSGFWKEGKNKIQLVVAKGEGVIQRNPGISVLSCCGIGLGVGFGLGWLLAKEEREARSFTYKIIHRWADRFHCA